jgi:hypothetical protein
VEIKMEYIERYIHEVGRYLPREMRDDVLAELRSHLLDTLEARSDGREPSEALILDVLKESGPPAQVAASYAPSRQYVIGPTFYPVFMHVITIGLAWLIPLHLLGFLLGIAQADTVIASYIPLQIGDLFSNVTSFIGVTGIIFLLMERFGVGHSEAMKAVGLSQAEWDPRTLPEINVRQEVNRGEIAFEIAVALIGLGLMNIYGRSINPANPDMTLFNHPVLRPYMFAASAMIVVNGCLSLYLLYRGTWNLMTRIVMIAVHLVWVGVLVQAASLDWGVILLDFIGNEALVEVGQFVPLGLAISAVVTLINAGRLIYNEFRNRQAPSDASGNEAKLKTRSPG